jgi:hypothetical protein
MMAWITFARRHGALDGVEEAHELLVPVPLHAAADHGTFEHIERGEQCGRAVADIIMRERAGLARLEQQSRLGTVDGLDLRFFVNRQDDRVLGRGHVQTDDVLELGGEVGIVRALEGAERCGCSLWAAQNTLDRAQGDADGLAMARQVQWVASPGGSAQVSTTTRWMVASPRCGLPCPRAASRKRRPTPASANRRCQRQAAGRPTLAHPPPRRCSAARPRRG